MADRISRSSTEIVKLANRLSKTETASKTNHNENIDTFRGKVYVTDSPSNQFTGALQGIGSEIAKFQPKEAKFDKNNDPVVITSGEGVYHQCYVYYYDYDPPEANPNTEEQFSDAYWHKVKKLNKALFPKQSAFLGFSTKSVANESLWKLKFLKGGPSRGEKFSGLAISPDQLPPTAEGAAPAPRSARSPTAQPSAKLPPGVEAYPSELAHWKCVNGSMIWAKGRREGKFDAALHNSRKEELEALNKSPKLITPELLAEKVPWLDYELYLKTVAASESGSDGYQAENDQGYYGKYQFGYEAMIQHGMLHVTPKQELAAIKKHRNARVKDGKGSRYSKATTEQMFLDADWDAEGIGDTYTKETLANFKKYQKDGDGAAMMQVFKDASQAQENGMARYSISRLLTTVNELSGDLSDMAESHGLLKGAHLVGFGDSISSTDPNFEKNRTGLKDLITSGKDTKDDNQTTSLSYIKKATEAYIAKHGNPCDNPDSSGEPESFVGPIDRSGESSTEEEDETTKTFS